jgi:hypothetical protein
MFDPGLPDYNHYIPPPHHMIIKTYLVFETLYGNLRVQTNGKSPVGLKEVIAKDGLCAVVAEASRSNFACISRIAPRCTTSLFHCLVTRHGSNTTAVCISLLHHMKAFYVVTHSFRNKQLFWRPGNVLSLTTPIRYSWNK